MNLKHNFFGQKNNKKVRILFNDENAINKVAQNLSAMLPLTSKHIVIVCIGTDRSTGDSLGPLIGSKLIEAGLHHFKLYGTLDDPIHAVNLSEKIENIQQTYEESFIIGIDACLGNESSVGLISIGSGPVKPGAGVNKQLTPIGNIHITGIVNIYGFMDFFVLQNTRLSFVMNMANVIASGIKESETYYLRRLGMLDSDNQQILT